MKISKTDNRTKTRDQRDRDQAHGIQLLFMGLSYRKVAMQTGYSLPTVVAWAKKPWVKQRLDALRKTDKLQKMLESTDNLPAFMVMLSKRHKEAYLELFELYEYFVKDNNGSLSEIPCVIGQVLDMLDAGVSQRDVSRQTGASLNTINRYINKTGRKGIKKKSQNAGVYKSRYSLSSFTTWLEKHYPIKYALIKTIHLKYIRKR